MMRAPGSRVADEGGEGESVHTPEEDVVLHTHEQYTAKSCSGRGKRRRTKELGEDPNVWRFRSRKGEDKQHSRVIVSILSREGLLSERKEESSYRRSATYLDIP